MGVVSLRFAGNYPVSRDPLLPCLLQGVEFFDEKLNSLCMAWLVDHGEYFWCLWEEIGAPGGMQGRIVWGRWGEWGRLESLSPMLSDAHADQLLAFWSPREAQGSPRGCLLQSRVLGLPSRQPGFESHLLAVEA